MDKSKNTSEEEEEEAGCARVNASRAGNYNAAAVGQVCGSKTYKKGTQRQQQGPDRPAIVDSEVDGEPARDGGVNHHGDRRPRGLYPPCGGSCFVLSMSMSFCFRVFGLCVS